MGQSEQSAPAVKTATKSKPKDKKEKYWPAPEAEQLGRTIVTNCNAMFHYINLADFVFLFKKAKERADKNIKLRIIKEPISLVSSKKVMVFIGNEWWDNNIDSDRTKALIESFLSIKVQSNSASRKEGSRKSRANGTIRRNTHGNNLRKYRKNKGSSRNIGKA